jgi:SAM-dependent methyltransferase
MGEHHSASSQRTFRDPAGSIEIRPDGAFRYVNPAYASEILAFLSLPIAARLVASGQLISTEILTTAASQATPEQSDSQPPLLLRHPRVSFVSYPWEWAPALWLSAAELTLNLCSELLKDGWILKDATPLNVLFQGVEPVFVDVLSIERADLKQPIWLAYGQFIRTFLLPMLAHARLGWPLQVALTRRDGFEPEEIYAALSWTQRLRQPALSSVTLPMLLSRRNTEAAAEPDAKPVSRAMADPEIARQVLLRTLSGLRSGMRRVTPSHRDSTWSNYVNTANHYTSEDHAEKRAFVSSALATAQPSGVLDVGCNTGVYSILAADAGAEVVSIDTDLQAVDRLCTTLKGSGKNILPLCVDLARPTPSAGWENRENASFLSRATGHFDTVMMLAVLHHLLLQSQIPLAHIADLCNKLTTKNLILEWVPPLDSKFQQLLRGRGDLYTHITETAFREAFAAHFTILREVTLSNQRILFHFTKTPA